MLDDYYTLFRESARILRELANRAPDISNELRRFADDLEQMATRRGNPDQGRQPDRPPAGG
jgi:hypothetical protein